MVENKLLLLLLLILIRNLKNEEAKVCYRAVKIQPQWDVTPEKQTTNYEVFI